MPRDLGEDVEEEKLAASPPPPHPAAASAPAVTLTESPNSVGTERSDSPSNPPESPAAPSNSFVIVPPDRYQYQQYQRYQSTAPVGFHPYTRPLTISDLDSVTALENAAFPNPVERATREKLEYRLSKCGEICYGLFCTVVPGSDVKAATLETGRLVETSRKDGAISVLIGHVISTKSTKPVVTDEAMDYPKDWASPTSPPSPFGHQESGRTIALHSVAILPEFHRRGLGRILMLSYMQHMNGSGIADRLALIAHDHKMEWYEKLGFGNKGKSDAQFGGGGWFDMIFELKAQEARTAYG